MSPDCFRRKCQVSRARRPGRRPSLTQRVRTRRGETSGAGAGYERASRHPGGWSLPIPPLATMRIRIPLLLLCSLACAPPPPAGFTRAPGDSSLVWIRQAVPTQTELRGLAAASRGVVWATGRGGVVAHTRDGGVTWLADTIPDAGRLFLVDVYAADDRSAVVLGTDFDGGLARIYRTVDGGLTWSVVYEDHRDGAFYDGLACWDLSHCVAFGDAIDGRLVVVRTEDGRTWLRLGDDALPPALAGEGGFAASGTAVSALGRRHAWIGTGGGRVARVYRSDDGGASWSAVETPLPASASAGIFGVAFADTLHGIAVGGDYANPRAPGPNVLASDDGGRSWHAAGSTSPAGVKYGVVHLRGTAAGYVVVGPTGSGWTLDAGRSWTAIDTTSYNTVAFASPAAGWVAGPDGRVARASNAPHR